jgi:hypothetical protein
VFQQIQERLDSDLDKVVDDEERDRQEKKHYLFKLCQQLERHLKELPVVGFNYGKYDVNAMKVYLFAEFTVESFLNLLEHDPYLHIHSQE